MSEIKQFSDVYPQADLEYRGWHIEIRFIGYTGAHPDYDAWTEGEGAWADNGLHVHGMTVEDVKAQIDCVEEER